MVWTTIAACPITDGAEKICWCNINLLGAEVMMSIKSNENSINSHDTIINIFIDYIYLQLFIMLVLG